MRRNAWETGIKILLAGNWHSELHEEPVRRAFETLGHEVVPFKWYGYFTGSGNTLSGWYKRAQRKFCLGPVVNRVNRDLTTLALDSKPDVLFVYRGDLVYPGTLAMIRSSCPDTILLGYNNDDPYSPAYPSWLWRHFRKAIPAYDLVLAYREQNVTDFRNAGARHVRLMRSWFIPERNFPLPGEPGATGCDVVFVGHYEADERLDYLEEIARQGFQLKLYGPGYDWDPVLKKSPVLREKVPVKLVWGEEYNRALNQSKIALCFFSKLNRDTYTRRCFEIPASGTVMLSQYSEDLAGLFTPDREAVYFSSKDEMLEKIRGLLANPEARDRIAQAGHRRVVDDGHDVLSRMCMLLGWITELFPERVNKDAAPSH